MKKPLSDNIFDRPFKHPDGWTPGPKPPPRFKSEGQDAQRAQIKAIEARKRDASDKRVGNAIRRSRA